MKSLFFLAFSIFIYQVPLCQVDLRRIGINDSTVLSIDSISVKGSDYTLTHYHMVSRVIERKIILDTRDSIFNDEFNNFSRLIFKHQQYFFDIPTVPLTHVFFLENAGLILGLSKISFSPYHIVLYSMDGKLLHKATLGPVELKTNKTQIRSLLKIYPKLHECLSQMTIVKENDFYYLEISPCLINAIGRDSVIKLETLALNYYFPLMDQPITEGGFEYIRFYNFFSSSDPLNDLITIGSVPYLLILNSEKGTRVNIPLKSNCDIFKELSER